MEKTNVVVLVIDDLNVTFEIEAPTVIPGVYGEFDVSLLAKDRRKQINEFEIRVVKDFYKHATKTLFDGEEKWFENISENYRESQSSEEGIPNVFMSTDQYEKFLNRFNEYKAEYDEIKASIISEYDDIVASFKIGFKKSFPEAIDKLKSIPSKLEYEKSRKMSIHKKEFIQ